MSFWVGKSREELNESLKTHQFTPHKPKSYVIKVDSDEADRIVEATQNSNEKRGRPRLYPLGTTQRERVRAVQLKHIKNGKCETGCGNKPEMNPKSGKPFLKCRDCRVKKAKWYQSYRRNRPSNHK
jgi:hypothetical protein